MAKFCGNCGAQLDDGDKVCGQCGTPVNGNTGTVPSLKVVDPEKKKVIVYDFEQEEIPKIYGFDTQVPVGIFGGECKVDFARIYEEIRFIYKII